MPTEMTTNAYNVEPGDNLLLNGSWIDVKDCGETNDGQGTWLTLRPKNGPDFDHTLDSFKTVTVRR
jgi:hypothetical protein